MTTRRRSIPSAPPTPSTSRFSPDFPASATLRLGTNYRSTQSILTPRTHWPPTTRPPVFHPAARSRSRTRPQAPAWSGARMKTIRAHWSANRSWSIAKQGTALREQAVLCAAHHSDHLEIELAAAGSCSSSTGAAISGGRPRQRPARGVPDRRQPARRGGVVPRPAVAARGRTHEGQTWSQHWSAG